MRVTNMIPDVMNGIQQSEQALQKALQQLSTGMRVNQISDDPGASAALVQNQTASANVDQYTKSISSLLSETQTADGALSSVVASLTQAVTLGTGGTDSTLSAANRQVIVTQVQGVLDRVVSQANLSFGGTYLFAGTASDKPPFTADASSPSGYKYNGNSGVNTVRIGEALTTPVNVSGSQVFDQAGASVIGSLTGLITALQTGTPASINAATANITAAINHVGEQRVLYANVSNQLTAQDSYLSQETITLSSQLKSLIGIDYAVAATNLSQATLNHNAVLAAAGKVLPNTLLDYLK